MSKRSDQPNDPGERGGHARSDRLPRRLPALVARFIETEASGGIVLVAAALVALVWANSPWREGYETLWHTRVLVDVGPFRFDEDLGHVVNDALMALFFFVVGLEIKREVVRGELANPRVAALPVFAAIGGMVVPAALYLLVAGSGGGPAGHGWGIPMATDIAFALGVLALLGPRIPVALKLFLLALAIVDDIGAIVVIAIFYGGDIDPVALAVAAAGIATTLLLRWLRVDWWPAHLALAVVTWYATYLSGVHATIAGVALALTTPAHRRQRTDTMSPIERLEELLHPLTSFVVLPVFALANAGVVLRSGVLASSAAVRVAAGVVVGLVGGKLLGIVAGAWIGTRVGAALPAGTRWRHVVGAAALGGIGFTVSLFVASLAFTDPELADAAKLAILAASLVSAVAGTVILRGPAVSTGTAADAGS